MLAAPCSVGLVVLKVRSGAGPAFALLRDVVKVGKVVDGIDAVTIFRLGNNQRPVFGRALRALQAEFQS